MGSNKHKHKAKKRKHYRSSDSSEKEHEKEKHRHRKKHHKEKKEKRVKPILVDEYESSSDDDDVIIVSPPPPPKISHRGPSPSKLKHSSPPRKVSKIGVSPPPPPVISRQKSPTPPPAPPLSRDAPEGVNMGDFVHKPPENIRLKSFNEKLKEKLTVRREKRILEDKLSKVKKLAEGNDSDEDVNKWVAKNRKIVSEKEEAEKRAKELDAMDEVFGIGELIEEDMRMDRKNAYNANHLRGLKVEHSINNFIEGRDVILTLKDKEVLDEKDDTLINVNLIDEERYKKNIDRSRKKPGYNAYDDDEFNNIESTIESNVLSKYDEEIEGEKKSSFAIGDNAEIIEAARKESIRNRLQQYHPGRKLESLAIVMQPVSEYFTEQEIQIKFKKLKKKVNRKIRKVKPLKADDLLRDMPLKQELVDDPLQGLGTRRNHHIKMKGTANVKKEIKQENGEDEDDYIMDVDDLPALAPIDTSKIKIEVDDEHDLELQLALRRLKNVQQLKLSDTKSTSDKDMSMNETDDPTKISNAVGGSIILNATAEFCRTLGDIPTYGQAGNREEEAQELLDFDQELKEEKVRKVEFDPSLVTGWNEVALDATPVDIASYEVPILDAEPDISCGVAGALKMAICKGYIQTESEKKPSASRFAHLQAQNYSIEDKAFSLEDDKHARRERYNGPTSDFKEKEGYKPNVKLEYIDDDGHLLSSKEAFRYMSHKFHGKGPGKNKIEKRMKKGEQETLMKQMSSTDTPLGTLSMLQQKQRETQSPFVVLSGSKHGHSTAIAKLKLGL